MTQPRYELPGGWYARLLGADHPHHADEYGVYDTEGKAFVEGIPPQFIEVFVNAMNAQPVRQHGRFSHWTHCEGGKVLTDLTHWYSFRSNGHLPEGRPEKVWIDHHSTFPSMNADVLQELFIQVRGCLAKVSHQLTDPQKELNVARLGGERLVIAHPDFPPHVWDGKKLTPLQPAHPVECEG